MKLSVRRLFARSMTGGFDLLDPPVSPSPRSAARRAMLIALAGLLAIVGALAGAYYFEMRPVTFRIAVGPANSDDVKLVQALTQAFTHSHGHVRLRPLQTDGATASAEDLAQGKVDLAIIRGDLDVPKNAQAVATLRKNFVVLWAPPPQRVKGKKAGPKITKISQLAGRRVGVIGKTQANVNLLKVILQQYSVDPAKVEVIQFPANEAAEAIRHQKADVYLAAGPLNSKITAEAIAASSKDGGTPTFLSIDSAEAIAQNHAAYEAAEIPAGAFGGSPDRPGAAAFVDGEEKTFLDRYSDYIWWGLMALSAMGSVGAWFAGYLKKDERNNNTTLRERLLDMIVTARRSESPEELDQMQAEADDILRDTLHCYEHGTIEEGALTAFNIALEQFHNAVADRKALLFSLPQNLQRAGTQLRATGAL